MESLSQILQGWDGDVGHSLLVPSVCSQTVTQGKVFTKSRPLLGWEGRVPNSPWHGAKDINALFK